MPAEPAVMMAHRRRRAAAGEATLFRALDAVAARRAEREAITCGDVRIGYGELVERVRRLASGLRAAGVTEGSRVALLLANGPHYVEAFFAVAALGAVAVPVDPRFPRPEVERILADSQPSVLLAHPEAVGDDGSRLLAAAGRDGGRVTLLTCPLDGALPLADCMTELGGLDRTREGGFADPVPDDVVAVFYTSGTIGRAAGVMHTHAGLMRWVTVSRNAHRALRPGLSMRRNARIVSYLARKRRALRAAARQQVWLDPIGLHNISGHTLMIAALLTGSRLVLMERFHPRRALELVAREGVTGFGVTPVMLELMLRSKRLAELDLSSLLQVGIGGELASPDLVRRARERLGCVVGVGYGSTELGGPVLRTGIDDEDRAHEESVGRPVGGVEVRIVDADRAPLPPGAVGELACRVRPMMAGYWRAPELTAAVTDPAGWYYTGDVASLDADGYVRVLGRTRDSVDRGGATIHPAEVEHALKAHPRIREAAVVGVPANDGREQLWAFVVAEPGAELSAPESAAHCKRLLAPAKAPDEFRFRDGLPRTPDGKIRRAALRSEVVDALRGVEEQ